MSTEPHVETHKVPRRTRRVYAIGGGTLLTFAGALIGPKVIGTNGITHAEVDSKIRESLSPVSAKLDTLNNNIQSALTLKGFMDAMGADIQSLNVGASAQSSINSDLRQANALFSAAIENIMKNQAAVISTANSNYDKIDKKLEMMIDRLSRLEGRFDELSKRSEDGGE